MQKVVNWLRGNIAPLLLFVLLLLYFSSFSTERGFGYFLLLFLAALLFATAGFSFYGLLKSQERQAARLVELAYWVILVCAALYFVQLDPIWLKLTSERDSVFWERLRQILRILYFCGFFIAVLALVLFIALRWESRAALSGIITLGGLFVFLVALNFWSHISPAAVDMTLMRRFSLSKESRELLRGIELKVEVTAFFPFFSEFYRDTELLLRDAVATNSKISYTFIDPLREKELADKKKVDRIGTILIEAENPEEKDPEKRKLSTRFEILDDDGLKRLERELVSNLLQVSGKKRTLYYTQGHDEKPLTGNFGDDTITVFDESLRVLRHFVKKLTPNEGYPGKMPKADLVMIVGPRRNFNTIEKNTLKKYFDDGGRIFLALDPESAADFSFLFEPLKVRYVRTRLLSDYSLKPDKSVLQTVNYSEHAITAPFIRRPEERKLTLFPGAGYFESTNETNPDIDINYFLLSHYSSWVDKIPNGVRDEKSEPIAAFKLGFAALSKKNGARLVAIADSDFLVNRFIDMQQNRELTMRIIGWLLEDEKLTGIVPGKYDDEKVKLSGIADTIVFHLFLYIIPGAMLVAGFLIVRAKKRRMSEFRQS